MDEVLARTYVMMFFYNIVPYNGVPGPAGVEGGGHGRDACARDG